MLGHGFLWIGVVNRLHSRPIWRPALNKLTRACVAAFLGLLPMAALQIELNGGSWYAPQTYAGWPRAYLVVCATIGVFSLCLKCFEELTRYDRRVLVDWRAQMLDAAATTSAPLEHGKLAQALAHVPGNQVAKLSIDRKTLVLPHLPDALDGFRIVHLSDLHMTGRIARRYFEFAAEQVNELEADVIAVTGDIVESESCRTWLPTTLGRMNAAAGKYFVLGNHDLYIDAQQTRDRLVGLGWKYASENWLEETWRGVATCVGGNERPWRQAAPLPAGADAEFHLVLLHTPDEFSWACQAAANLALAGHTHGGQIRLPGLGPLASPSIYGTRYACGLFRRGDTVLHVTRGVGGKTPIRWNCPPEVAVLELSRGSDRHAK